MKTVTVAKKPDRILVNAWVPKELADRIDEFRRRNSHHSRSESIREILDLGLEVAGLPAVEGEA